MMSITALRFLFVLLILAFLQPTNACRGDHDCVSTSGCVRCSLGECVPSCGRPPAPYCYSDFDCNVGYSSGCGRCEGGGQALGYCIYTC
ncbi:hypothetical protein QR680_007475 [Steinernema hermaphroditum]|uniref:Uncharacterized protein n=1 Tax=Steinernema hermaphroditum TaxID=289476 RepID=A0AA39M669_9BILA|nr:hypothetical protein QR680_007475 [Steinernema hermaphroditum]